MGKGSCPSPPSPHPVLSRATEASTVRSASLLGRRGVGHSWIHTGPVSGLRKSEPVRGSPGTQTHLGKCKISKVLRRP